MKKSWKKSIMKKTWKKSNVKKSWKKNCYFLTFFFTMKKLWKKDEKRVKKSWKNVIIFFILPWNDSIGVRETYWSRRGILDHLDGLKWCQHYKLTCLQNLCLVTRLWGYLGCRYSSHLPAGNSMFGIPCTNQLTLLFNIQSLNYRSSCDIRALK